MAQCYAKHIDDARGVMQYHLSEIESTFKDKDRINAIMKAQRLWREYSEYECEINAADLNGVWGRMVYGSCIYNMILHRIEHLEKHNCYENGCPQRK